MIIPGNDANPNTDPGIINALRSINPWVDQADFAACSHAAWI